MRPRRRRRGIRSPAGALLFALLLPAGAAASEETPGYRELLPGKLLSGRPVERLEQIEPLLERLRGELDLPEPGGSAILHPVPDLQGGFTALSVLQLDPAPWPALLMTYFHELGHRGYHRERAVEEARAELLRFRALFHLLDREPSLAPLFLRDLRSYQRFREPLPFPDPREGPEGTTPVDRDYRDAAVVALALWHGAWRAGAAAPLEAARRFIDENRSGEVRLAVERERARPGGQAAILRAWAREEILPRLDRAVAALPEGPARSLISGARLFYRDPLDREGIGRAAAALRQIAAAGVEPELAIQAAGFALSVLVDDLEETGEADRWLEGLAGESGGLLRATLYRRLGELRESSFADRRGAAEAYRASLRVATVGSLFSDEVIGRLARVENQSDRRVFTALSAGSPGSDLSRNLVRYVGVLRILGRDVRAAQLVAENATGLRPPEIRALLLKERAAALASAGSLAEASEAWHTLRGRTDEPGWKALAAFREGHDGFEALRREQIKERQREKAAERAVSALRSAVELLPPDVPSDRAAFDLILLRLARGRAEGIETEIASFLRGHPGSDLVPAIELVALPPARAPAEARRRHESDLQARLWAWLGRHVRDRHGPAAFGRLAATYPGAAEKASLAALCRLRYPRDETCGEMARRILDGDSGALPPTHPGPLAGPETPREAALAAAVEAACRAATAFRAAELLLAEEYREEAASICDCRLDLLRAEGEDEDERAEWLSLRARARPVPGPSGSPEANP